MSDKEIKLQTRQDSYDALLKLIQQARYSIDIFSHHFDGNLYNTPEMMASFKHFILDNRQAKLRLLLQDSSNLIRHGHQIIELRRRLTSQIHIHQATNDFDECSQTLILIDKSGFLLRPYSDRYEGIASLNNPLKVKTESIFFEKAWETSHPSQEMRQLYI